MLYTKRQLHKSKLTKQISAPHQTDAPLWLLPENPEKFVVMVIYGSLRQSFGPPHDCNGSEIW